VFVFDKSSYVGIDIGSYSIKVIKVKGAGPSRSLEAVAYSRLDHIALPEDNSKLSEILRNLFNVHRIKSKKIATAISGDLLTLVHLYLPHMPKKDMKEAVRWEMRKQITFSADELICDFAAIGEVKRGDEPMVSLIAFGVQKKDVKNLLGIFDDALLEPERVDAIPMAMLASFDYNNIWEDGINYSMLDIGDSKSTLTIFKDKKLMFARDIHIAGKELTNVVMKELACAEDVAETEKIKCGIVRSGEAPEIVNSMAAVVERLAAEVHRSFDYYQAQFREGGISKMFLCGGTSKLAGIDDFFANMLGIPCFIDDPLRNIKVEHKKFELAKIKSFAPDLTIAVGLAL